MVRPDARLSLISHREQWDNCTACDLHQAREASGGRVVHGEGAQRGILFLCDSPNAEDVDNGQPLSGNNGALLNKVIEEVGIREYFITNLIGCRACEPSIDPETGLQRIKRQRLLFRDTEALPPHIEACKDRLYQEIYTVDPIFIVTLGGKATEYIGAGKSLGAVRGTFVHVDIPGAMYAPVLTEKRKVWGRKRDGALSWPVEQRKVRYAVLPTFHPSYVISHISDQGTRSPYWHFVRDIKLVAESYENYLKMALEIDAV